MQAHLDREGLERVDALQRVVDVLLDLEEVALHLHAHVDVHHLAVLGGLIMKDHALHVFDGGAEEAVARVAAQDVRVPSRIAVRVVEIHICGHAHTPPRTHQAVQTSVRCGGARWAATSCGGARGNTRDIARSSDKWSRSITWREIAPGIAAKARNMGIRGWRARGDEGKWRRGPHHAPHSILLGRGACQGVLNFLCGVRTLARRTK